MLLLIPWMLGIFVSLVLIGRDYYIFVPIMFLIFLMIIPITIVMAKGARKASADAFYEKDINFYVENGKLYTDGMELTVTSDEKEGVLFLENYTHISMKYNRNVMRPNFIGRAEGQYAKDLAYFLQKNGVNIRDWEESLKDMENEYL